MPRTDLLNLLACPLCAERPKLQLRKEESQLVCPNCSSAFSLKQVEGGLQIPDLLPENAIKEQG